MVNSYQSVVKITARVVRFWCNNHLLHYAKKLEARVIKLREEVNEVTPNEKLTPYFELYSDVVYENNFY